MLTAAVAVTVAVAGLPAAAQTKPPIVQRAEACLAANVDHVVAVEHDLQLATQFLATYACPAEVEGVTRYERNLYVLKAYAAMANAMPSFGAAPGKPPAMSFKIEGNVDPDTGEIVIPQPKAGEAPNPLAAMLPQLSANMTQMYPDSVPASIKKLAGELVYAAIQRQGSRPH